LVGSFILTFNRTILHRAVLQDGAMLQNYAYSIANNMQAEIANSESAPFTQLVIGGSLPPQYLRSEAASLDRPTA
jgi:hypothetical protein